jgi:hypothetical protein
MTVCVRRMGIVALPMGVVVCLTAPAAAAPRAQFTSSKELPGYFAVEVGRAVADALDQVDAKDVDVTGRVEELPPQDGVERVRLSASIKGRSGAAVSVDGAFEEIDALCVQLASKIYPLIAPDKPSARPADRPPDRPPDRPADKKSGALLAAAAPVAVVARKSESARPTEPSKTAESKPAAITPVAASAPAVATPPPTPPAPDPPKPTTPDPPTRRDAELLHPYGGAGAPPAPAPYYVRGRVVAHTIADSPNAWPGAGRSATHALYDFLGRRLRLAVVPIGIGLSPPHVALDEGVRSAARAVVMARLHSVEDRGMSLRCRLEVVVVKEGSMAMRRIVEAEAMRRVQEDPLFVATTQALEAISADLNAALADVR